MIKLIEHNNCIFAKLIRATYQSKDTDFFTSENDEIQLGIINYKKNHKTGTCYHTKSEIKTTSIDEIIIIQEGSARIDFYNKEGSYIKSTEAFKGDIIIFYCGGHNILFYDDTKVLKIKSGAYKKDNKVRIIGTNNSELVIEKD